MPRRRHRRLIGHPQACCRVRSRWPGAEGENGRLKKALAEAELDKAMFKATAERRACRVIGQDPLHMTDGDAGVSRR